MIAITGQDPMQALRKRYRSQRGAARLIAAAGGLYYLVCQQMGEPLARPVLAVRGDLVLVSTDNGPALAVCTGSDAVTAGPSCAQVFSLKAALAAWRV